MIPMLWAVFLVGPKFEAPLYSMPSRLYTTQAACEAGIPDDLERVITITSPDFHLECRLVLSYGLE